MTVHTISSRKDFVTLSLAHQYLAIQAYTTYCQPCKTISPIFEGYASEFGSDHYVFAKFDIDAVPDLAFEFGANTVPAFYFFEDGDKADSVNGANVTALKKMVDEYADKAKKFAEKN